MAETSFHLFAYGTLRDARDSPGRELLRGCERLGRATARGTLFDLGAYPAALLSGDDPIAGTLWRCPASRLGRLDRYEGVADGLFRRIGARIAGYPCWVYVAGPRLAPRLTPDARVRADAPAP
ncbi:MAG: gamma-glutamylcyclotransferase [Gemmatimonadota bacterium]